MDGRLEAIIEKVKAGTYGGEAFALTLEIMAW